MVTALVLLNVERNKVNEVAAAVSEMDGVSDLPITSSPTWNSVTPVPT